MKRLPFATTEIKTKMRAYWPLVKGLQTGLLVSTGLGGYMSARCPIHDWATLTGLLISLVASISGSTILNMWWDRDIDAKMGRTQNRPLVSGKIQPSEAMWVGLILSMLGVAIAVLMNPLFGLIIFAGVFFDVVVYTIWLKRRTCWSIIIGGLAGGMPILAGRVLGLGSLDWVGILLCLAVLFWIPTHIMTFSMKYHADYKAAGVPTFPSAYGFTITRGLVAISSVLAALSIGIAAYGVGMTWGYLRVLIVLSTGLFALAVSSLFHPSERTNFGLFKYASLYMLSSMLLMVIFGILDVPA
ncbi:MAG: heme o synthase [Anaerolineales bacterium]